MNRDEFLSDLTSRLVRNNWDLPKLTDYVPRHQRYDVPNYPVQEEMKAEGRRIKLSPRLEDKLIGYGLEAYAHFFRSLEAANEKKHKHPERFSEYFAHWLHSDPAHIEQEVFRTLGRWFPRPKKLRISKGKSYWSYRNS